MAGEQQAASAAALSPFKEELMTLLNIPTHLADRSERNLHVSFQKYKACLEASQVLAGMVAAGTWPGRKPSNTDIVEIFVSKSMWFSHYKKNFAKLSNYPLMVEWLENGDDKPDDATVWGLAKSAYTFKDLSVFLGNGGTINLGEEGSEKRAKGKKKARNEERAEKEPRKHKAAKGSKKHSK